MVITDQDIVDLTTSTLQDLGRLKFTSIAMPLQRYEVMPRILRRDKVVFDSGIGIRRNVMVDHAHSAKQTGLYGVDRYNVRDVLKSITVPWRRTWAYFLWERREILENRSPAKIVDLMKVRRIAGMLALAAHMEDQFWSAPTSSTNDLDVFGVPYWVVRNATLGFNGGNPTGFASGAGGLDSATYAQWKNYSGTYAAVTKDDLIKKMRTAKRLTSFESPVDIPDYRSGRGQRFRIYMNEATLTAMESIAEGQNDKLGSDLAPMDGSTTFRKNPLRWIPKLDEDSTNPIFMLDWEAFYPVFLRGDYLREGSPEKAPNQHNVFKVDIDTSWNVLCDDRRCQTVLYQA